MPFAIAIGISLSMAQGVGGGGAPPAPGIVVSNQASPATTWTLTPLADLTLIDPQPGDYIEIEGAPTGFAIVGGA